MRLPSSTWIQWIGFPSTVPRSTPERTSDRPRPSTFSGRPSRNSGLTRRAMAASPSTTTRTWRQTGTGCSLGLRA